MSKSYKVLKTVVHMGPKNGKTLQRSTLQLRYADHR